MASEREVFQMRFVFPLLALVAAPLGANAVTFEEMKVTNFVKESRHFYRITVQGTVKDQEIVCAILNASGDIVASKTKYTDNMATNVLIRYDGNDVASATCVKN